MDKSGRVLWVTNLAAPYRLPVWADLSARWDLTIGLLESNQRLRRDAAQNRGRDWRPTDPPGEARMIEFPNLVTRRGEERHYLLTTARPFAEAARSDVILLGGWDSPAYFQLLLWARAMDKPVVGFYESTLTSQQSSSSGPIGRVRARFFRSLDRVVVPGPAAHEAVAAMGVEASRILTGFNAVDVERFRTVAFAADSNGGHRYLYVGQLIDRKNVDAIIRAFDEIADPEDCLTLIGTGPLESELQAQAARGRHPSQVVFEGYVPNSELPQWMARHDSLVLASHREVWGLVVNEALAAGMRAVITENCGVVPSVRGMPGVFVAEQSDPGLEEAMRAARAWPVSRVDNPPVLEHTPAEFANVFEQSFSDAIAARRSRS